MRRADRLFDIIQILRSAPRPITANKIAEQLEVTQRTIYRDIAALQASRIPIEGEAGIGYVMLSGYDLPPLMFNVEELEALVIGLAMLNRTTDRGLHTAAKSILDKVSSVAPSRIKNGKQKKAFYVSQYGPVESPIVSLSAVRQAIRQQKKLKITYRDAKNVKSTRTIWPLGIAYFIEVEMIGAWCESRQDLRNFRIDRIEKIRFLKSSFPSDHKNFMHDWLKTNHNKFHY